MDREYIQLLLRQEVVVYIKCFESLQIYLTAIIRHHYLCVRQPPFLYYNGATCVCCYSLDVENQ